MSYYQILGLEKEPFSTSPDPAFFYQSKEHKAALYRLRIAVKLKRGLSVILGDIGTGKTTLSRRLFQVFRDYPDVEFHMILNPIYRTEEEFLEALIKILRVEITINGRQPSIVDYMSAIEKTLFNKGVEQEKTIVLLIDEAQKLSSSSLEVLRGLLNYETNEFKILQLILMSQLELLPKIKKIKNFWDRINLKYMLKPLDISETKELIEFRLEQAGFYDTHKLFTNEAIKEIHSYTQGYPRRITLICHDALEMLVMKNKEIVDCSMIKELVERENSITNLNISSEQSEVGFGV